MGLRIAVMGLGLAAISVGASNFLLGAQATANLFEMLLRSIVAMSDRRVELTSTDTDNELRFYSVLWIAFGVVAVGTARNIDQHWRRVPILLGVFFAGGLGRLLSWLSVGEPHLLFVVLMWIELATPAILMAVWLFAPRPGVSEAG